jgi:hypothetical protein
VIGAKGFVTSLHDRLLADFEDLGAPRPIIFRDVKQIEAADQFEPRLGKALEAAKVLVVVLSRNWLESDWCRRELHTFVEARSTRGEDEVSIRERIILVQKHSIPPEARPKWLQGQAGHALLTLDKENQQEIEYFDAALGRPNDERWFTTIRTLAKQLRSRVHDVSSANDGPPPAEPAECSADGPVVYVAYPAADMKASFDTLVLELRRRGVQVVPDPAADLPKEGQRAIEAIDEALSRAKLSIHLLGDKAGFQPEDALPIVRLQLERAAVKLATVTSPGTADPHAFHRLIWAPRFLPGSMEPSAARNIFDVLARHSPPASDARPEDALRKGDKLDGDTLTKFIQFVVQHLDEIIHATVSRLPPMPEGAQIYVQHDENDVSVAEAVAEGLAQLGFSPLLPVIEGDTAGRIQIHRDLLRTADAVVLCWAMAAPVWVRATASELRRWQDLGRTKKFDVRTVVALPPEREDKKRLRKFPPKTDLDLVIDATSLGTVNASGLDPFLRGLCGSAP